MIATQQVVALNLILANFKKSNFPVETVRSERNDFEF